MVAGLSEDADLPNGDTGCQSVNDEIQRHGLFVRFLQSFLIPATFI